MSRRKSSSAKNAKENKQSTENINQNDTLTDKERNPENDKASEAKKVDTETKIFDRVGAENQKSKETKVKSSEPKKKEQQKTAGEAFPLKTDSKKKDEQPKKQETDPVKEDKKNEAKEAFPIQETAKPEKAKSEKTLTPETKPTPAKATELKPEISSVKETPQSSWKQHQDEGTSKPVTAAGQEKKGKPAPQETPEIPAAVGTTTPVETDTGDEKKKGLTPKRKKVLAIVGGCAALLIAVIAIVMVFLSSSIEKKLDVDTFYDGIFIEDVDLSGKTMEEAETLMKDLELDLRDPIDLTLTYNDKSYHYTEDDFTFVYNTDEILKEAYQIGREGNIWLRYFKVLSLKNNPEKLALNHELDQIDNILAQIAAAAASELNTEPKDASVGEFDPSAGSDIEAMFHVEDGVVGIEVDQTQLVEDCRTILESEDKTGTISIKVTETPFEVDKEQLMQDITKLASYSTKSTNTANGNHNMANALNRINGTVLQPGDTFSFNGTVGRRTAANGFRAAGVIKNGELVDGLGGGVCQASTTVYGAAIRAGLEVVERGNHRWPSSYVPIGQDAMVSWGSQDMKFKNNTDYPIYIKSYMSGTTLNVIIYGHQPEDWDKIEITSWKTSTLSPGAPTKVKDSSLPKGTEKVKIEARAGSTASAQRTYYKDGKKVKTEALPSSRYNPVNQTILVGTAESPETTEKPEKTEEKVEE
ncbi:VanW family protein [Massiliimalia massiliensis]|uniref:VanW family protein n=1 Tax=Massiliimalia massiliensis TaxID=1852384 RepID=UPI000984AD1A|nr:VanW family protein [Massiliimalia massiliensis]